MGEDIKADIYLYMPTLLEGIQKKTEEGKEEKEKMKALGDSLKEGLIIQGFAELAAEAAKLSALAPGKIDRIGYFEETDKTQFVQKVSRFLESQQNRDRPNQEFFTVPLLDLAMRALGPEALYQKFGQNIFDLLNDLLEIENAEKIALERQREEENTKEAIPQPLPEKLTEILKEGMKQIDKEGVLNIVDEVGLHRAADAMHIRESKSRYDVGSFSDSDRILFKNLRQLEQKLFRAYSGLSQTEKELDINNNKIERILDIQEKLSNIPQERKEQLLLKNVAEHEKQMREMQEEKRKKEAADHLDADKIKQSLGNT